MEQGRGVILLTYHSNSGQFALALLERHLDLDPIIAVNRIRNRSLHRTGSVPPRTSSSNTSSVAADVTIRSAARALMGKEILTQGGVVKMHNEYGYDESGTLPAVVGGRRYNLKSGFAELALLTGAAIVPCYATRLATGPIGLIFLPPLDVGNPAQPRQRRIAYMVEQYARFLEQSWRQAPESLVWEVMRYHVNHPAAAAAAFQE
jgi:KDO2-lipid IV(A) lauroyltransferase